MITEELKNKLDNFLGKNANLKETNNSTDGQQVCDLDTGICYIVRSRDGLIERVENSINVNKKIQIESPNGDVKQLLNG